MNLRLALAISNTAAMLVLAPALASPAGYRQMNDEDFFLDRKTLLGKKVEVPAHFQAAGDTIFMVLGGGTNATFVNVHAVPRDVRKSIQRQCQQLCAATVRGVVRVVAGPFPGATDVGIVAETFELQP